MFLSLYEDFYKWAYRVDIKIYLCTIFYSNKLTFLLQYYLTGLQYILTGLKLPLIYMTVICGHISSMKLLVGTWKAEIEIRVILYGILRNWLWVIRLWLSWFGIGSSKNSLLLLVLHFWGCNFRVSVVFFNITFNNDDDDDDNRYTLALFKEYFITLPLLGLSVFIWRNNLAVYLCFFYPYLS